MKFTSPWALRWVVKACLLEETFSIIDRSSTSSYSYACLHTPGHPYISSPSQKSSPTPPPPTLSGDVRGHRGLRPRRLLGRPLRPRRRRHLHQGPGRPRAAPRDAADSREARRGASCADCALCGSRYAC